MAKLISQKGNLLLPSAHIDWFRKTGLIGSHDSKLRLEISYFDDNTVSELAKLINGSKSLPSRELRRAMLKSRFADTILKTKSSLIQDPNQQFRSKLGGKGFRRVLNDAIKATKEVGIKVNVRDSQREEARKALSKMKNTAGVYDNCWILGELESVGITDCYTRPSVLQDIGLFLKGDDCVEQIEVCQNEDMEVEEGEIVD